MFSWIVRHITVMCISVKFFVNKITCERIQSWRVISLLIILKLNDFLKLITTVLWIGKYQNMLRTQRKVKFGTNVSNVLLFSISTANNVTLCGFWVRYKQCLAAISPLWYYTLHKLRKSTVNIFLIIPNLYMAYVIEYEKSSKKLSNTIFCWLIEYSFSKIVSWSIIPVFPVFLSFCPIFSLWGQSYFPFWFILIGSFHVICAGSNKISFKTWFTCCFNANKLYIFWRTS